MAFQDYVNNKYGAKKQTSFSEYVEEKYSVTPSSATEKNMPKVTKRELVDAKVRKSQPSRTQAPSRTKLEIVERQIGQKRAARVAEQLQDSENTRRTALDAFEKARTADMIRRSGSLGEYARMLADKRSDVLEGYKADQREREAAARALRVQTGIANLPVFDNDRVPADDRARTLLADRLFAQQELADFERQYADAYGPHLDKNGQLMTGETVSTRLQELKEAATPEGQAARLARAAMQYEHEQGRQNFLKSLAESGYTPEEVADMLLARRDEALADSAAQKDRMLADANRLLDVSRRAPLGSKTSVRLYDAYRERLQAAEEQNDSDVQAQQLMGEYYSLIPYFADYSADLPRRMTAEEYAYKGLDGTLSRDDELDYAMTDDEAHIMAYLRKTQGADAANAYREYLLPTLQERVVGGYAEGAERWGEKSPVVASVVSVVSNLAATVQGAKYIAGNIFDTSRELDPYDKAFDAAVMRDAIRRGVSKNMSDVGRFVYQSAMSAADSAVSAFAASPLGAWGVGAAAGLSGMVNSVREAKLNGASDTQALTLGAISGTAEVITEKLGFDRLFGMIGRDKTGIMRELARHVGSEFGEEAAGEIINLLADTMVMGDRGAFAQAYESYIAQGIDEKESEKLAFVDMAKQVGLSGLGGAIGGGLTGGTVSGINAAFTAVADAQAQRAVADASKDYNSLSAAFRANYEKGKDPFEYQEAFDVISGGAAEGLTLEGIRKAAPDLVDVISAEKQYDIWRAARNAAKAEGTELKSVAEAREEPQNAASGAFDAEGEEVVMGAPKTAQAGDQGRITTPDRLTSENAVAPGVVRKFEKRKLTHDQRAQLNILDKLGKRYGVEFDVVETIEEGRANASYAGGKRITVALDAAENAYVQAASHELVHYVREMDDKSYGVLESVVLDALKQEELYDLEGEVSARLAEYERAGQSLTREAALEEIVAEAVPTVFTDERSVRALIDSDRSLAVKIRDFIVDFVKTLRDIAVSYSASGQRMEIAALMDKSEQLEEIAKTFDLALESAAEQTAQTADQNEPTKFSLKNTSEEEVDTKRVLEGRGGRPEITISGGDTAAAHVNRLAARAQRADFADVKEGSKIYRTAQKNARRLAKDLLKEYSSTYDRQTLYENMEKILAQLARNGVTQDGIDATTNMAKAIIEQSKDIDSSLRDQYADLRNRLRTNPISLTETQKQEAANITGSYSQFRKGMFGFVNLSDKGPSLDAMWNDLSGAYPDLFPPDLREGDMVARLLEVKGILAPRISSRYSDKEGIETAATELSLRIHERLLKSLDDKEGSKGMQLAIAALRRTYNAEIRAELQRVRKEQIRRFQDIGERLQAARRSGDQDAVEREMTAYRAEMKRQGFERAEAEARVSFRTEFEGKREWTSAYKRINQNAQRLRAMLAKPNKTKHVPIGLENHVLSVLKQIDFERDGKGKTEGTKQWQSSLQAIGRWLDEQLVMQESNGSIRYAGHDGAEYMTICADQISQLEELIETIVNGPSKISGMSLKEIKAFSNALSQIHHILGSINTTWRNRRSESIDELGGQTMAQTREIESNRAQNSNALVREMDKLLNVDQLDAGSYFARLGGEDGAAYSLYEELRRGQSAAYARIREANTAADEIMGFKGLSRTERAKRVQTIRGWAKEKHTVEVLDPSDGDFTKTVEIRMSGTQLMELYALSQRTQGRKHILSGGIKVSGRKGKTGDTRVYQLSEEQLKAITNQLSDDHLSDDQMQTVHRMQDYLSSTVAEWGNEVTEEMYLYRAFTDRNYWPIRIDSDYKNTKQQDGSVLYNALLNSSFTKQLEDTPMNPIIIGDAIETFSGHVSDMAVYSGLAMPLDDLLKWYNFQVVVDETDDNGNLKNRKYLGSVKKEITRVMGRPGVDYFQRLLDDLNGMSKKAYESAFDTVIMGNLRKAAVAGKLRVAVQQPTSIARAAAEMDPRDLLVGAKPGKGVIKEMLEHSALAWWKSNGNYEIGTGASMKSVVIGMKDSRKETLDEAMGAMSNVADNMGWAVIWQGVKREIGRTHEGIAVGSEEYWELVVDRFEDVAMNTQVVDTVLTKSQLMRSKSGLTKAATAFMSEPTRQFNMVRSALSEIHRKGIKKAGAGAYKKLGRTAASIMVSGALNAFVTAVFDMLRYWEPDKKEEDGTELTRMEMALDNYIEDLAGNLNPLQSIPYVRWMDDALRALISGTQYRADDNSLAGKVYELGRGVEKLIKQLMGENTGLTTWGAVKPVITNIGDVAGLPISGIVANTEFLLNAFFPGITKSRETAADIYMQLYNAIASGDTTKAARLRTQLRAGKHTDKPKSDKEIDTKIRDILALEDDRIRQCYELRMAGNKTRELAALEKKIEADGFTDAMVKGAVNRYPDLVKAEAEEKYLAAFEAGENDKAEHYAAQLRSIGMEQEEIDALTAEKNLDEQLESKMYEKSDLYNSVRNGTAGDIEDVRDYVLSTSSAEDPEKALRSSLTTEFKEEYIALVNSGKTAQAELLADNLVVAGLKRETIENWAPAQFKDELTEQLKAAVESGSDRDAEEIIHRMIDEGEMTTSSIVSRLNTEYKPRYIELVTSGQEAEAEALAERLAALNLRYKDGKTNYYRASVFADWLRAWELEQEEDDK